MKKLYKEDLWNKLLEEVVLFSNDKLWNIILRIIF